MEVKDVMLKRRSVRKFTDEKVSTEAINTLLHYAMSGPSACNKRPWEFYVVTDEKKLSELRDSGHFTTHVAPLAIVVCGNLKRALPMQLKDFWIQDCAAAMENILLGAADLGLGACWEGITPMKKMADKVRKVLEADESIVPLGMAVIGHPSEFPEPRDQYDENRVHYVK